MSSIPSGELPCTDSMQRVGAWYCPNLICQTLLTHGSTYLLGGVDGHWAGRRREFRRTGERENCGWNAKIKDKKKNKNLFFLQVLKKNNFGLFDEVFGCSFKLCVPRFM